MTIYDVTPTHGVHGMIPNSENAWIVTKNLDYATGVSARGMQTIEKRKDRAKFETFFKQFEDVWNKSIPVKLSDGRIESDIHRWNLITEYRALDDEWK